MVLILQSDDGRVIDQWRLEEKNLSNPVDRASLVCEIEEGIVEEMERAA